MILLVSCFIQKEHLKTVKYATYSQAKKVRYFMNLPAGFEKYIVEGGHEKEFRYVYPDSSIIYITNDPEGGSPLNYENICKKDKGLFIKKLNNDTLYLEGAQENNLFWKENKLGRITVGYVNVPKKKKELYDSSINSIEKK